MQFEAAWGKHKDDPNLANLESSLSRKGTATVNPCSLLLHIHNNCSAVVITGLKAIVNLMSLAFCELLGPNVCSSNNYFIYWIYVSSSLL